MSEKKLMKGNEAMAEAVDAGKAAIEQAADKEAVLAALETAKEAIDAVVAA